MAKMNWNKVRQQKKTAHGNFEYVGNKMSEPNWCTEKQYNYLKILINKSKSNLELAKKYNILTKNNKLLKRYELDKNLIIKVIDKLINNK